MKENQPRVWVDESKYRQQTFDGHLVPGHWELQDIPLEERAEGMIMGRSDGVVAPETIVWTQNQLVAMGEIAYQNYLRRRNG